MCATCAVHVRHPAISSQRARASTVGKTPSFSFCQVDMYGTTHCIVTGPKFLISSVRIS